MTEENKGEESTAIVVNPTDITSDISLSEFASLGLITPIADLSKIRAAFAFKQKLLAAILDPTDYIYSAEVREGNRTFFRTVPSLADAQKVAQTCGTSYRASPKKSGIVKLAAALGIQAQRTQVLGLPLDPGAHYSYVEYTATHPQTGKSDIGVGWADRGERTTALKTHEIIATADTRAYNRAILRLSGFGDVSAEEMDAIDGEQHARDPQTSTPVVAVSAVAAKLKPRPALPEASAETVIQASQAWLDAITTRGGEPLPAAQQSAKSFRELRAKARRGDVKAATEMGSLGLRWEGAAQDDSEHETFTVERETVSVPSATAQATGGNGNGKHPPAAAVGWDLSGGGTAAKDDTAPTPESVSYEIPQPDPSAETITLGEAKKISALLIEAFGSADASRTWLKKHARVEGTPKLRSNQFEKLMSALKTIVETKNATAKQEG